MRAVQKRIRDVRGDFDGDTAHQLIRRTGHDGQNDMQWLGGGRMVEQMLSGLVRIIIMDRTVVFMVVLDVFVMLAFMDNQGAISGQQRSPLHGKAM